jgi:16S rRNA (cytidine1402-2'-O)-methyltransferase
MLYVVATPIGNLEDITIRGLKALKEAALIAAEDTRRTRKLLSHYGIKTRLTSYHEHNEREKAAYLLEKLKSGLSVALVADAGTPAISDPGDRLVKLAVENGIAVSAVPGASSLTAVLSIAGLPTDEFIFLGFVPSKEAERKRCIARLKEGGTFVVFESARRLKRTLEDVKDILGDCSIVIGREMTKLHEEILRGKTAELLELLKERELKGEVAMALRVDFPEPTRTGLTEELHTLLSAGIPFKDAVKIAAKQRGLPKSHVYKEALKLKKA